MQVRAGTLWDIEHWRAGDAQSHHNNKANAALKSAGMLIANISSSQTFTWAFKGS